MGIHRQSIIDDVPVFLFTRKVRHSKLKTRIKKKSTN